MKNQLTLPALLRLGIASAFLVMASASLAQVSVTIGVDQVGIGDSAEVPVSFQNVDNDPDNSSVVAFNFDILYDDFAFSGVDIATACDGVTLDPGEVFCSLPEPGVVRIVVFSSDLTPVESTVIATLGFLTESSAGGGVRELSFDQDTLSFSDDFGNAINIDPDFITDGEIIVGQGGSGDLIVTPPVIDFGELAQGGPPVEGFISVGNDIEEEDLLIDGFILDGDPGFTIGPETNCPEPPFTFSGLDSCIVQIIFDPADAGLQSAEFIVESATAFAILSDRTGLVADVLLGEDAELAVFPLGMDFGTLVAGGAGACQELTVENIGSSGILSIVDFVFDGAPFELQENTCIDVSLEPEEFCTVDVCFVPEESDVGFFSDLLVVVSDVNSEFVELSGTSEEPSSDAFLQLNRTFIDFGTRTTIDPQVCETTIASNSGSIGDLEITEFINLFSSPPFFFGFQNCSGLTLGPGESCNFSICYNPDTAGEFSGTVGVISDVNSVDLNLLGTAELPPNNAFLQVAPTVMDFGTRELDDDTICQTAVASNSGTFGALEGLSVSLLTGAPFSIAADSCTDANLAPAASCTFSVCFAASEAGDFGDQVIVSSSVNDAGILVQGQVEIPRPPGVLVIAPDSHDFGARLVGTTPVWTSFQVANAGPEDALDIVVDSVELSGDEGFTILAVSAGDGFFLGDGCQAGTTLVAGGPSCSIAVAFAPTQAGDLAATLEVQAGGDQSVQAGLAGAGRVLDNALLDDLIVFRGERFLDSVGSSLDFVRGFINSGRSELMFGAPGGYDGAPGAAWVISDILLGLGSFADSPPLLEDIAASDGEAGVRITPESVPVSTCFGAGQGFGYGVAGLRDGGDDDADSLIAISAPGWAGNAPSGQSASRGAVFLLSGSAPAGLGSVDVGAWLVADEDLARQGVRLLRRAQSGACIGSGLRALGDIDGSGESVLAFQDLPMSISGPSGASATIQTTYIIHQPGSLIGGPDVDLIQGHANLSRIRVPFNEGVFYPSVTTVANLGDFNSSGFDDVVLTAPNARFYSTDTDSWHTGAAFVLFGREGGLPNELTIPTEIGADTLEDILVIFGPEIDGSISGSVIGLDWARFGASVDGAGDFNGNGFADLVIGIGDAEGLPGSAAVIFGGNHEGPLFIDQLAESQVLRLFSSDPSDNKFGESVRGVGDISGNGLGDILIGVPWADLTGADGDPAEAAGRVYQVNGRSGQAGSANTLDVAAAPADRVQNLSLADNLPGVALANSRFGLVMAGAGADVTGNQAFDLAVGAWRGLAADGSSSGGWAVVLPGQAEPSALSLAAQAAPPIALIPGRPVVLNVANTGPARVNELTLTVTMGDSSIPIEAAVTRLQACGFDGTGFRCGSATESAWQCETGMGSAVCTLPSLGQGRTIDLLLAIGGEGPADFVVEVQGSNAATVELATGLE